MVEHVAISDPEIHEPKNISTATTNEVYVADGAGSGSWVSLNPYAGWRYSNIGTGTTFTTPTAYTLVNVTSTSSGTPKDFTNNGSGRLTYTGTPSRHLHAVCDFSFKHSTGGGNDVYFAVYKNGAILTQDSINVEMVQTADSANYQRAVIHFDDMAVTNDYYEVYTKTSTGNVIVHTMYMFLMGMPG